MKGTKKMGDNSMENSKTLSIGLNTSFYFQTLFPLYYNFFNELGFNVVLPEKLDETGLDYEHSQFCYPMQQSLCFFKNLLDMHPNYIFLPAIFEIDAEKEEKQRLDFNCACAFVTGEPYILRQAFKNYNNSENENQKNIINDTPQKFTLCNDITVLSPSLNFSNGLETEENSFINIANTLGITDVQKIKFAYSVAMQKQKEFQNELYKTGKKALDLLTKQPEDFAIVLLGRSYNSCADIANKAVPRKFSSRGITIIPQDMIDIRDKDNLPRMYWEIGNRILNVAEVIKNNKQLFAVYITNFSCAPDSMLLNTFRKIMGDKPSLTLEIDSHSADAGINTRIDAFIDIVQNYRQMNK
jgi:predicted nucleotide-binding protein (sugar kinase/HSP70/actin superfamily)